MDSLGKTTKKICESKVRFHKRKSAEQFAELQWRKWKTKTYLYICPRCLDWHLSTKKTETNFIPEIFIKK